MTLRAPAGSVLTDLSSASRRKTAWSSCFNSGISNNWPADGGNSAVRWFSKFIKVYKTDRRTKYSKTKINGSLLPTVWILIGWFEKSLFFSPKNAKFTLLQHRKVTEYKPHQCSLILFKRHAWPSYFMRGHRMSCMAIIFHAWPSYVMRGHLMACVAVIWHAWPSYVMRGHRMSCVVIICYAWPSYVMRCHHMACVAVICHAWPSPFAQMRYVIYSVWKVHNNG